MSQSFRTEIDSKSSLQDLSCSSYNQSASEKNYWGEQTDQHKSQRWDQRGQSSYRPNPSIRFLIWRYSEDGTMMPLSHTAVPLTLLAEWRCPSCSKYRSKLACDFGGDSSNRSNSLSERCWVMSKIPFRWKRHLKRCLRIWRRRLSQMKESTIIGNIERRSKRLSKGKGSKTLRCRECTWQENRGSRGPRSRKL